MATTTEVTVPGDGGTPLRAALALPETGAGPWPGVLVIHEVYGLNEDIRRIAERFADNGYAALAPDLYARGPKLLCIVRTMRQIGRGDGEAFRDLEAARAWLAARPDVDSSRIGVAGFCMGGGFALLYAVRAPVGATAPFYGAVPANAEDLRGVPPVCASYGERDRVFAPQGRRLERQLQELGVPHDVKLYDEAGHSFMSRHAGFLARVGAVGPMKVGYRHDAAEDAWRRMLAFFAEHLARERDQ